MEFQTKTVRELKTYSRSAKPRKHSEDLTSKLENSEEPLTTKDAIRFLLNGTLRFRVCRYCLNKTSELNELDEVLVLAGKSGLYEVTIKDIIASFHPFKVAHDSNFPNKICKKCLDKALACYLFTQQCEQSERALRNYFEDMDEKFSKLDPLEPVKRRGKPKLKPNYNVLHAEHLNIIDYAEPIINIVNLNTIPLEITEENELECSKCWQLLPNKFALANHEKSHPKTMWYHCKLCGKSFVKYSQLKKHKRIHAWSNEIAKPEIGFTCQQCGVNNKSLDEHLRHIEKHKFKNSLDNLIKRNTSNMCSICFNIDEETTEFSKTMSFHGGLPGLTGEKSIYSMVSSVFPDHKKHKYQELLLPTNVTHLRVMKRKFASDIFPAKKMKYTTDVKEILNINFDDVKRFLFSEPDVMNIMTLNYKYTAFKEHGNSFNITEYKTDNQMNIINNCELIEVNDNDDTEKAELNSQDTDDKSEIKQIQINSLILEETDTEKEEKIDNNINLSDTYENIWSKCKLCWIFKKPNCISCKELSNKNNSSHITCKESEITNENQNKQKNCKFCYMFTEVGYCNFCKKITNILADTKTCLKDDNKEQINTTTAKWQCEICLADNINRETCICCDENNTTNKNFNVVLNNSNFLTVLMNKVNENNKIIVSENNQEDTKIIDFQTVTRDIQVKENIFPIENNNDTLMEFETIEPNCIPTEEFMDFEEGYEKIVLENTAKETVKPDFTVVEKMDDIDIDKSVNVESFAFNIGVGNNNKRKKPIRRLAALRK
ncbi:uncharacterized protein LOC123703813 isoform X2 [Colias croceus]|uniref:uncharacterized protein LOC123703813 isoform X2 n=1 Tax=Colias crocea TaxID=72248 RepID=UPI001E27E230|nr:uncharacterized protein LOC123703813 isoform X2 [Colias croceus]